jgi:hypothetical protein
MKKADSVTRYGVNKEHVKSGNKNSSTRQTEFLTIKEFAHRMSLGYTTAWELSRCKDFLKNGISVKVNPLSKKRGGVRIDWVKYLSFVENHGKLSV